MSTQSGIVAYVPGLNWPIESSPKANINSIGQIPKQKKVKEEWVSVKPILLTAAPETQEEDPIFLA